MSKKPKKHNFVHRDPDNVASLENSQIEKADKKKKSKKSPQSNKPINDVVFTDLKKTVTTIGIFITILIIFYFLNRQLNFLDQIKNLF